MSKFISLDNLTRYDNKLKEYILQQLFYIPISSLDTTTVTWTDLYEAYEDKCTILANIEYVENSTTVPVTVPLYSILGNQSAGSIMFTFVMGTKTISYIVTGSGSNVCTVIKQISDFELVSNKIQDIAANSTNTSYYSSAKAVFDFVSPVTIWEETTPANYLTALQSDISASPAWQLTNLDMTPFKRIKIYSCAGKGSTNISTTPAIVLEMSLDERAVSTAWGNNYVASVVVQKPNDANRLATLTCAVSADKTKFVVLRQTSLYGTAATTNNDIGADVFKIEGFYY